MGVCALVVIAVGIRVADLAQDDHTGRTAIDTQCAPGAHVVVDRKDDIVGWIETGLFGSDRFIDSRGRHHMDALPRANIDTAFAHDALGLIDICLLYTSPSPRDRQKSRMPSSA